MNRLKFIALFLMTLFAQATLNKLLAQTGSVQFFTINQQSLVIKNLALVDSAGAGNKIIHTASFDISIDNNKETMLVLSLLQSSIKNNKAIDIYFTKTGVQPGKAIEERKYRASIVKEIKLPVTNATSKEMYIIRVSITAETVAINYDVATTLLSGKERTKAIASNFRIAFGDLPSRRISKVESMKITGASKNETMQFNIELLALDERAWNEVYNNGSGKMLLKGKIEMLSPDLKEVLLTIILEECKIVSYRSVSGNGQTIAKVAYGIQPASVSFEIK